MTLVLLYCNFIHTILIKMNYNDKHAVHYPRSGKFGVVKFRVLLLNMMHARSNEMQLTSNTEIDVNFYNFHKD